MEHFRNFEAGPIREEVRCLNVVVCIVYCICRRVLLMRASPSRFRIIVKMQWARGLARAKTGLSTLLPFNSCRMKSSYPAHLPGVITAPQHILPFLSFKTHCTCKAILTWIADRTLWDTQKQVTSWLMCSFLLLTRHKSWINSYKSQNNTPFMFT
jgi:hypothetical protein